MKSKSTAAILAFFFGGLGVHRFYLGQTGLGFLYLIFCWTFIPLIAAFIDFVIFLTMSEESFNLKYNNKLIPSQLNQSVSNHINVSNGGESDLDRLEKLARLRDSGVISDEEFQRKKRIILAD